MLLGELREGHQGERIFYLGPEGWTGGHGAFKSESGCTPEPTVWQQAEGRGFLVVRQVLGPNVNRTWTSGTG